MTALEQYWDESARVHGALKALLPDVERCGNLVIAALSAGKKVLICGNGGSAADAQHFAAELVCRYHTERRSLPAIALTTDTSGLTAIGNDYGYEYSFSRQVEGLGEEGDVIFCISTSGNSPNVVNAAKEAKRKGLTVVALTGEQGGRIKELADIPLCVPSATTARIQECHIFLIHCLCEMIDDWAAAQ